MRNQDEYLNDFGLMRRQVLGDGNCLFRAISFVLLGDEDSHEYLRQTATEFMNENLHLFQDFFHPDDATIDPHQHMLNEIKRLSRNGVYAGQESVVALSLALGVNILVTYGGTIIDSRVFSIEHFANKPHMDLHIAFTNFGGGHYDAVVQRNTDLSQSEESISFEQPFGTFKWEETEFSSFSQPIKNPKQSGLQTISCKECHSVFSSLTTLQRHNKRIHSDNPSSSKQNKNSIRCMIPSCPARFNRVKQLLPHLTSVHSATLISCG